jgi:hypothetical protein
MLQIDGLELLALSTTISPDIDATLLGAAQSARQHTTYRGRWPNYSANTLAATDAARVDQPTAFRHGTTMTLANVAPTAGHSWPVVRAP